jgi:hypothetical protein
MLTRTASRTGGTYLAEQLSTGDAGYGAGAAGGCGLGQDLGDGGADRLDQRSDGLRMDEIDRSIVTELQRDTRQTNRELAHRIGVAPSTCTGFRTSVVFQHHRNPAVAPLVDV